MPYGRHIAGHTRISTAVRYCWRGIPGLGVAGRHRLNSHLPQAAGQSFRSTLSIIPAGARRRRCDTMRGTAGVPRVRNPPSPDRTLAAALSARIAQSRGSARSRTYRTGECPAIVDSAFRPAVARRRDARRITDLPTICEHAVGNRNRAPVVRGIGHPLGRARDVRVTPRVASKLQWSTPCPPSP